MFWSPPAALPHSPLLAPTKCDRWGGNLGDPPCPLPPLYPPPLTFFLPILPSHRESIWENGGEFLRGTMMDLAAITPLPQHQTSSSLQKEKKSISDFERRLEKSKTYDWVVPHSLFPAHIHVWMCPATITQECRTKSPFSRPCPAPHSPLHSHERVISHPQEQLNSRRWHNKSFKVIAVWNIFYHWREDLGAFSKFLSSYLCDKYKV